MKSIIKNAVSIVLFCSSVVYGGLVLAETGLQNFDGMTKTIGVHDKKKNLIEVGGTMFAYDDTTKIISTDDALVTEDELLKGDYVTIRMDTSQRYLGYPLLSHIFIKTIHY